MKSKKINAISLRATLVILVILLCALIGAGFYYAQNYLVNYASDVSQTVARSKSGGSDLQSLQALQSQLDNLQGATTKASSLSISKSMYETQAINDLNTYASRSGIKILSYSFSANTPAQTAPKTKTVGSTSSATIKVESPISYTKLIDFMSYIESNLPKMQISSLTINKGSGSGPGMVNVNDIVVDIQVK